MTCAGRFPPPRTQRSNFHQQPSTFEPIKGSVSQSPSNPLDESSGPALAHGLCAVNAAKMAKLRDGTQFAESDNRPNYRKLWWRFPSPILNREVHCMYSIVLMMALTNNGAN